MRTRALLALLLLCSACAPLAADEATEQEVARLDQSVVAAIVKGDVAFVERTYSPDYTFVGVRGETLDRAQSIADMRSGKTKYDDIKVTQRSVRVYGNTALVTGVEVLKGRTPAGPFDSNVRFIAAYTRRGNRWLEVYFQATPIATP